jgi:hypothetical protein
VRLFLKPHVANIMTLVYYHYLLCQRVLAYSCTESKKRIDGPTSSDDNRIVLWLGQAGVEASHGKCVMLLCKILMICCVDGNMY